jgi:nucleoid-associated protein
VHDLKKSDIGLEVVLGRHDLGLSNTAQRVIDALYELYSRRASKSHGKFSENEADYPTQKHLRDYLRSQPHSFAELTSRLMTTLLLQAQRRPNSAGGHVFFAHFERDGRHYLLVAIVNDKLGATLTTDFEVTDVQHLDMDGFRFAGRINLTGWTNSESRYIGFLKGKGDVSEYFKEFLGCDTTVQEKQDTHDLVVALKEFTDIQKMDPASKDEFLNKAKSICERSAKNHQEINFSALANELIPTNPEILLDVLTDPDRGLNDQFIPNRRALGALVKFKAKTPLWSVEFEREALTGGSILYNSMENTLTIKDLPPNLIQELRAEREADV